MHDNDVVVTGRGVCCNLGGDLPSILDQLRTGQPRASFERWLPAIEHNGRGQLKGSYPGDVSDAALGIAKSEGRFMGRSSRLALLAARAALAESKIDPTRLGIVVGSGTGDVDAITEIHDRLRETRQTMKIMPTVVPRIMASTVPANLANVLRTKGPSFAAVAACAGGAYNLALSAMLIQSGHMPAALAGGTETCELPFFAGFDSMRAYNGGDNETPARASRPYAADRAGFVQGEGAGVVVLETRSHAEARGATILGTLVGWGMSSDGEGKMVAPGVDGAFDAMRAALHHAKLDAAVIDYVNTHGTSTPLGDVTEVRAIMRCMQGRHVAYSSTKAYTGHTITASGAIEAIFTWAMLSEGWIAPAIHAVPLDPELEAYPPVLEVTTQKMRYAMSNSFGFGGTNVSLVLAA